MTIAGSELPIQHVGYIEDVIRQNLGTNHSFGGSYPMPKVRENILIICITNFIDTTGVSSGVN